MFMVRRLSQYPSHHLGAKKYLMPLPLPPLFPTVQFLAVKTWSIGLVGSWRPILSLLGRLYLLAWVSRDLWHIMVRASLLRGGRKEGNLAPMELCATVCWKRLLVSLTSPLGNNWWGAESIRIIVILAPSPMPPILVPLAATLLRSGYIVLIAVTNNRDAQSLEKRLNGLEERSALRVLVYDPDDVRT